MGFFSSCRTAYNFSFFKKKIFEQKPKDFLKNTHIACISALPTAYGCTPTEPLPLGSGTKMNKKIGWTKSNRLIVSITVIYWTMAVAEKRGDACPVTECTK